MHLVNLKGAVGSVYACALLRVVGESHMNEDRSSAAEPGSVERLQLIDSLDESDRNRKTRIRVYVNDQENLMIRERASHSSMKVSEYLRWLGLGYEPPSTVDAQVINQLANVNVCLESLLKQHPEDRQIDSMIKEIRLVIARI